jgi:tRNA dimethylallyltransferase
VSGTPHAILIAGPTASGKSALALALAEEVGGIVVNADSMQVYRDLRVVTARPTPEEEARAPHRLYGHVDAAAIYSVGHYVREAAGALAEARRLARIPIFVGGTGLYFKALTQGLSETPPIPDAIRTAVREKLAALGPEALHAELAQRDPEGAVRLSPRDRTRIARALEVIAATGRPLAEWHRDGMRPLLAGERVTKLFLAPERAALYARIDVRFERMLDEGALDEVRALAARGLDPLLPAMKAHGVPWLIRHLRGGITLAEAGEKAKQDTRHYAKRQFTWFRHQLPDWPQVAPDRASNWLREALEGAENARPLHRPAGGSPPPFHGGG